MSTSGFYSNEDGECWVLVSAAATEEEAARIAVEVTGEPVVAWGEKKPVRATFRDDEIGHRCGTEDGCYDHPECQTTGCPPEFEAEAWQFEEGIGYVIPEGDEGRVYQPEATDATD